MNSSGLVSIGYEGRTINELLLTLADLGVSTLVDVRLTPLSRKPGLSKTKLGQSLQSAGLSYVHLRALGNPKDNRESFWNGSIKDGCIRFSERLVLPAGIAAMDQLEALARDSLTAVLCFERDHERCHRQVIVKAVTERIGQAATVIHA